MRRILLVLLISYSAGKAQVNPFQILVGSVQDRDAVVFSIADTTGTVHYTVERNRPYDLPVPSVHVFENGRLLIVDGYAGVIELYDESGGITQRGMLHGSIRPDHERIVHMDATPHVAGFVVSESDGSSTSVYRIQSNGAIRSTELTGEAHAAGIRLSSDGALAAAGTYSWNGPLLNHRVQFLEGERIMSSGQHDFKGGLFGRGDSLFLVYGRNGAAIMDVRTGAIVSETAYEPGSVVNDLVWVEGTSYLAISQNSEYVNGRWYFSRLVVLEMTPGKAPVETRIPSAGPFFEPSLEVSEGGIFIEIDGLRRDLKDFNPSKD